MNGMTAIAQIERTGTADIVALCIMDGDDVVLRDDVETTDGGAAAWIIEALGDCDATCGLAGAAHGDTAEEVLRSVSSGPVAVDESDGVTSIEATL